MPKRKRADDDAATESNENRKERKRRKKEAKRKRESKSGTGREKDEYLRQKTNVFIRRRVELTLALLPGALGNLDKSINDSLRLFLLKYSDGLEGVVLSFENVKILADGVILNDLPNVHYDVAADVLVFCPTVGCKLQGVVTESFHSHLSLVVHHYFNASIPAEHMHKAGFEFEDIEEQWYWKDGAARKQLSKDDPVSFVCQKIHESGGIISLAGAYPTI
jgi:DNA-directed RNA polymerase subunit E'/Rpb7